jgi:hypothetical protein
MSEHSWGSNEGFEILANFGENPLTLTIVAGIVIGGAPVSATATPTLRGKDKKERKKSSCDNCLENNQVSLGANETVMGNA